MNPLRVNRMMFSEMFWQIVRNNRPRPPELATDMDTLSDLVESADYKTGTINLEDAFCLFDLVSYFNPKGIAEVGTFIGRSTIAMSYAAEVNTTIHTCDASNDIELPALGRAKIIQYQRSASRSMFRRMLAVGYKADLFYIDGRLEPDEAKMIASIHPQAVILLDDFEGVEKGVANAQLLLSSGEFNGHMLIYPQAPRGKTAVMLPVSILQFVVQ
jgi:hypothetical protein